MIEIKIPKNILKAMSNLCAKDDIRKFLNGVKVEIRKEHINFIATDGHVMGIYQYDNKSETEEDFIIPVQVINKLSRITTIYDSLFIKQIDNFTIRGRKFEIINAMFNKQDEGFTFFEVQGRFPDYKKIIPKKLNLKYGHYDPSLLIKFSKCINILRKQNNYYLLSQNGTDAGIITYLDLKFIGIIMTIRQDDELKTIPEWVNSL